MHDAIMNKRRDLHTRTSPNRITHPTVTRISCHVIRPPISYGDSDLVSVPRPVLEIDPERVYVVSIDTGCFEISLVRISLFGRKKCGWHSRHVAFGGRYPETLWV